MKAGVTIGMKWSNFIQSRAEGERDELAAAELVTASWTRDEGVSRGLEKPSL